jgi:hypothetical protein
MPSVLSPASAVLAGASTARMQHLLDAMTRHDLCARDDAGLRRLHRDLSKPSAARARAFSDEVDAGSSKKMRQN